MTTLTTERVLLRRWTALDIGPMAAINADPKVMRWIGGGTTRTRVQTSAAIEAWEHEWQARGFGLFAAEERASGALMGFVGLSVPSFLPEVMPAVEIGWRLGRPFWGQGFATEAARAVVRFAFDDCRLERIVSICQIGNDASERIMVKLGMQPDRTTVDPSCGRPIRVYAIEQTRRTEHDAQGPLNRSAGE